MLLVAGAVFEQHAQQPRSGTVLSTLAGLRPGGKLIGIISHVSALKERIAAQIQVIPETGGRSSLSGPGCQRIGVV